MLLLRKRNLNFSQTRVALPFQNIVKKRHLKYEVLLRLQTQFADRLANSILQLRVSLPGHIQLRKQVTDKPEEYGHVTGHYLRQVEVPQRPHQHLGRKMTAIYIVI